MSTPPTIPPNNLPPTRRIVVSNLPIPATLAASSSNVEPSVQISENEIPIVPLLGGMAGQLRVFGHDRVPTSNDGLVRLNDQGRFKLLEPPQIISPNFRLLYDGDITPKPIPNNGIVLPQGANIQFNEIAPGGFVPMHRTTSTDYAIFTNGQVVLITPSKAYDADTGTWKDSTQETVCNPGDVLLQRGTLHAWENRTNEWVRFLTVIIGSEPNSVEVEGDDGGKTRRDLPAVFDV